MTLLKLNNGLLLGIECYEKRARLVVYKNGVENVCRKESFKNLMRFVQADTGRLFKGRLQLFKSLSGIDIRVKGELTGTVEADDFKDCLEHVKNSNAEPPGK